MNHDDRRKRLNSICHLPPLASLASGGSLVSCHPLLYTQLMVKTLVRIGINSLIGAVLIFFWFKLVDIREVWQALAGFNLLLLIPATVLMILASVFKAYRFKLLLARVVNVPAMRIINLTFLSQLLSFTIPVRIGEVAKGVYLSSEYGLHFGRAVVWVFLDRFLDFWAVLGLSLVLLLVVPTSLPQSLTSSLFIAALVASSLVVFVVLKPELFKGLVNILSHLMVLKSLKKRFLTLGFFIIECFSLLKGGVWHSLGLLILTVAAVISEALCWYLLMSAFIPGLSVLKVWLGSMLNALTFLIPAAPGYVGSAEAAGLAVFTYGLGLDKTYVSAATVIFHAISLVFIMATGIIGLYALKFNLGLVWKKLKTKSKMSKSKLQMSNE